MASMDEQILKASKEIVVKFIEAGRVSPTGFRDTFKDIYTTISETVKSPHTNSDEGDNPDGKLESKCP